MYKILCLKNDKLCSYNIQNLEYKVGEWTYPEYGKLFIFDTLENLRKFYPFNKKDPLFPIYKCEVLGEPEYIHTISGLANSDCYQVFWENDRYLDTMNAPEGTMVVDAIKLIEQVD